MDMRMNFLPEHMARLYYFQKTKHYFFILIKKATHKTKLLSI